MKLPPATSNGTEQGVALLTALVMLAMIMLLGAATAQITLMNQKSNRNGRDRNIAFLAAEAALHDAVLDLGSGRGDLSAFPKEPGQCHTDGPHAGLCLGDDPLQPPSEQQLLQMVAYGSFTARRFAHGDGMLASAAPRYLVELLSLRATTPVTRYRITAIGFGPQQHSRVILQTVHAMETGTKTDIDNLDAPQTASTVQRIGKRLSWRELTETRP
jgi:type IV pilus assembly protein PilX